MAGIQISSTFSSERLLNEIMDAKLQAMHRAAEFTKGDIVARVTNGVGLNGTFPGYKESQRERRANKGLPTARVDHFFTGAMLGSLHTEVFREGENLVFEISPTPDQNAKVAGTHALRPWFGMTDEETRRAIQIVEEG